MQFFIVLAILCLIFTQSFAASCDNNRKEAACMGSKDDSGINCSWCYAAAVGYTCFSETDAKSLPSSIYDCEYQTVLSADKDCDAFTSEKTCITSTSPANGENCSWCKSAAVGATCFKESDARSLPSSIYDCEYQTKTFATASCDSFTSEKTCITGAVDGENCSWCKSAAVGATCFKESDARSLPASIYDCEYQQKFNLRG